VKSRGKTDGEPKPGAHLSLYSVLVFFWFLVGYWLLHFSENFPDMQGFRIATQIQIHHHFSAFFPGVG